MPYIDSIDKNGLVLVKFNATMDIEAALNETELALSQVKRLLQTDSSTQGLRIPDPKNFTLINNGTIHINGTDYPSLDVQIRPFDSDSYCSESLGFAWECINYTEDELKI